MALLRSHILIDTGTPAYRGLARSIVSAFVDEIKRHGLDREIKVVETGHLGIHSDGPAAVVYPESIAYAGISVGDVEEIVAEHLLKGRPVNRLCYRGGVPPVARKTHHPRAGEMRTVLGNVGKIDPFSIDEYIAMGGYEAVVKAITQMKPSDVIDEIVRSGLIGRSGSCVSTGAKWELASQAGDSCKTIICNAAHTEPGNFGDSLILTGDPHLIIEGMILVAYAVGAGSGCICIDRSYGESIEYVKCAIYAARDMGFLGNNVWDSGFSFNIHIHESGGDFVCSEDSALLESLAGRRGEPQVYASVNTTNSLYDSSVIHCAETLANLPRIIANGAERFSEIGTEYSAGTKICCVSGDVAHAGMYEVPFGVTLREIIYNLAGGIKNGKHLKAVLMGGSPGMLVGRDDLDRQICIEDLSPGSGALTVLDEDKCIVDLVQNIAHFFAKESCGMCTPCRIGIERVQDILTWCISGAGCEADLDLLKTLAATISIAARCDIGRSSVNALVSGLSLFENEFLSHARDKICPTRICMMDKVLDEIL